MSEAADDPESLIVLDANVLYSIVMTDLILSLGSAELFHRRWTDQTSTWVDLLDRRETEMTSKEKIQLRLDVQAKRDERKKRRTDTLVPVLTIVGQVLTAGAAVVSALVVLAALKKWR